MRAEPSWYFGALGGAFLALTAFAVEMQQGAAHEVRGAWMAAAPALLAIVALLGIALAGWRPAARIVGKVVAGAALGALATHLLLALLLPLAPGEAPAARAWAALEIAGWASLPAGILVATDARTPPAIARGVPWALMLVSVALAARLLWSAWVVPSPMRVGIAVSWASFVLAGGWAVLKLLRRLIEAPLSRPATPP